MIPEFSIHYIHQFLLYLHIALGAVGLIVFWLPTLSKKGSRFHKKTGRIFVWTMLTISVSGIIMSIMVLVDPVGVRAPDSNLSMAQSYDLKQQSREGSVFLLMLSILVFVTVRQSVLVLKVKAERHLLKIASTLIPIGILLAAGIIVGIIGIIIVQPLFIVFSIISISTSYGALKYIFKKELKEREWIIEHLGNIFATGIATYTAFFAFGGRRFFSEVFGSGLQFVPWILPSVIGVAATIYLSKKYRKKYRIND